MNISTSESNSFRNCKQAWWFEYDQLLVPRLPNEHFIFGTAIHAALAAYHGHTSPTVQAFHYSMNEQLAELSDDIMLEVSDRYEELRNLGEEMLIRYRDFDHNPAVHPFEVIEIEKELAYEITPELTLRGKIDGLVRDEYGKLFVLEHKTAKDITTSYIDNLDRDHQIDNYLLGAQSLTEEPIAGVMYNILAKKVPHPPKVLKNGSLSKDKRQSTTAELYREKITELGLTESDYSDILEALDMQGEPYFRRLRVYRNSNELDRARQELLDIAADMRSGLIYRNHMACKFRGCAYNNLCLEDSAEARAGNYRIKDKKYEELS